jgi:UPF0755 protein
VPRDEYPERGYGGGSGDPYASGRHASSHPGDEDDTSYLRTGYTGSGYGGTGPGYGHEGADYPDADYPSRDYGERGGAAGPGYGDDAGYQDSPYDDGLPARGDYGSHGAVDDDFARGDYGGEPGYGAGHGYSEPGYPADPGYPEAGYGGDGYAGEDYPDDGYRGHDDAGYPADYDYASGVDQPQHHPDPYGGGAGAGGDDRGYGAGGDWYGDVADERALPDREDSYEEGFLPGLGDDAGYRGGRSRGPATGHAPRGGRGSRAPAARPRGGKPKRKRGLRRAAPWIALTVLVVVLGVAGGGFLYVWHNYLHPPDYSGPGTGNVTVHITQGETAAQVGQQLVQLGVVASARAFSNAAKASGHGSALEVGYYRLHKHMSAALAFALLLKPSSRVQLKVLIPEGLRLYEIIALLGKDTGDLSGYQQASKNISALGLPSYAKGSLEGYLFPATYTVQPGTPPLQVLKEMVQRFGQEAASVKLPSVVAHDQISESDAITVASIVQAEGRRPQDLPKIARVIYNRLNAGMNLQLDTTVLYALHSRAADVTVAQTQNTRSPYNTYLHPGLPPGPIDSPGDAAIQAALHPAQGDWLYFLTVNPRTGLTKFTNNFTQFQAFQQELAANQAKH